MREITTLLEEINLLIKESGDIVDEIEKTVKDAKKLTDEGVNNLVEAREHHQSARKVNNFYTRENGGCVYVLSWR